MNLGSLVAEHLSGCIESIPFLGGGLWVTEVAYEFVCGRLDRI